MFRISGIIAFQTKKSNLEHDLRKETDIKMSYKGKSEISSHTFYYYLLSSFKITEKLHTFSF